MLFRMNVKCNIWRLFESKELIPGRIFSPALFEGLIFGVAYIYTVGNLHYKTDWVSFQIEGKFKRKYITVLLLFCFILYLRAISKCKIQEAYIPRGNLMEGFCVLSSGNLYLEGFIREGAYFPNFFGI